MTYKKYGTSSNLCIIFKEDATSDPDNEYDNICCPYMHQPIVDPTSNACMVHLYLNGEQGHKNNVQVIYGGC